MPHQRPRHLLNLILKRLKLWPVLAILGPRQVGKSTLLRDQLSQKTASDYVTLDDKGVRQRADKRPTQFLQGYAAKHLILDEVQKAPDLFDAIKAAVDVKRIPGRYILSGSTEFSRKTGIRESLTGRIGLLRLYPMTLAETLGQALRHPWVKGKTSNSKMTISDLNRRMTIGGMPGICFLRSAEERSAAWDSWLDTTCYRDLPLIKGAKLSGELAEQTLHCLAQSQRPTLATVAGYLKQDARRIRTHLEALEALFVINKLNPHRLGVGKTHYYLCDSGLAKHLGASETIQFKTWMLGECLSQHESAGFKVKTYFYSSSHHSFVDLIIENKNILQAYVFSDEEAPGTYVFRTAEAFLKKTPQAKVSIFAPVNQVCYESKQINIIPWTGMV